MISVGNLGPELLAQRRNLSGPRLGQEIEKQWRRQQTVSLFEVEHSRSVIGGRRKVAQNSGVANCILHSETRVSFKRTLKTWNTDLNAKANSVSSAEIREMEKAAPACFFARLPLVQKQRLLSTFIIELQKSPNKTWCDRTYTTPWYGTAIWTGLRYDKTMQRRKSHSLSQKL